MELCIHVLPVMGQENVSKRVLCIKYMITKARIGFAKDAVIMQQVCIVRTAICLFRPAALTRDESRVKKIGIDSCELIPIIIGN